MSELFKLTQRFVDSVEPPATKQRYPDHKVHGLFLRVMPSGAKTFVIRFRKPNGGYGEPSIGDARRITLDMARTQATAMLAEVAQGSDPTETRRQQREETKAKAARTFEAVVEQYRRSPGYQDKRSSTRDGYDTSLNRHLLPRLRQRPIDEITRAKAVEVLDQIANEATPSVSDAAKAALSVILSYAVDRGLIIANPMQGLKRRQPQTVRERLLSEDELRTLWRVTGDAEGMARPMADLIRMCMLLPGRIGELSGLRWEEVDFDDRLLRISGDRTKSRETHEIPLSAPSMELLARIREEQLEAPSSFPFKSPRTEAALRRDACGQACRRIATRFAWESFGPHDLRRTCATMISARGEPSDLVERVLGHKSARRGAIVHYDLHTYRGQKRGLLERWAEILQDVVDRA